MTIEDRLYLLHEMKECSRKNTEYLQNIPTDRHIQEPKSEHSFYDVSGSNKVTETSLRSIYVWIKSFIFRCVLCTMIFLGFYLCKQQDNDLFSQKIAVFGNALKKEDINLKNNNYIQNKIDSTLQQIFSK